MLSQDECQCALQSQAISWLISWPTHDPGIAKRMAKAFGLPTHNTSGAIQNVATIPTVVLEAMDGGVQGKRLDLIEAVKIGRQIS